jgi:hypothetical protein
MITILKISKSKFGFFNGFWITFFLILENSSNILSEVINNKC